MAIVQLFHNLLQVLGINPCEKQARQSTPLLAKAFIGYMKAPDSKLSVYTRHLALLVSTTTK